MAKIRFPRKVEIGGFDVKVVCPYEFQDNTNICGNFSSSDFTVRVDPRDIDEQLMIATFIHEFVHAVDYVYLGFRLSEETTDAIARGLLQVLRLNDLNFLDITKETMPESIFIGSSEFNINFPYTFSDCGFENTISFVPNGVCEIRISDVFRNVPVDDQVLRVGLMIGIVYSIVSEFRGDSEDGIPEGALTPLSNGLYQLVKNADLEERIKKWTKN